LKTKRPSIWHWGRGRIPQKYGKFVNFKTHFSLMTYIPSFFANMTLVGAEKWCTIHKGLWGEKTPDI